MYYSVYITVYVRVKYTRLAPHSLFLMHLDAFVVFSLSLSCTAYIDQAMSATGETPYLLSLSLSLSLSGSVSYIEYRRSVFPLCLVLSYDRYSYKLAAD